jgi:hypothetical protein
MHFGPQFLHHDPPNMGIVTGIWIFIRKGTDVYL